MAANDFSIFQVRRDRILNIVQGNAKFLNETIRIASNDELYCFMSPYDKLLVSPDELYDIIVEKIKNNDIKILYTDNIVNIDALCIRQYLPSIWYNESIVINTPLVIVGRSPLVFNENLERMFFWTFLSTARKQTVVGQIHKAIFKCQKITAEEQDKDLKCLKR
jgi:hypothetical protein